ncbi:hypothetical protein C8A01DRAFT_16436 [Parachaetomium inaequale]|uniref:Uncharacterized protein n=1 Tax=Parachaetomium inaequale TaxID=2588326 RepID=A0AAN6SQR0_9PEZI|nr:hypothetical protein C8A01DRAFT_16436 [Parachaetomium inaequale]
MDSNAVPPTSLLDLPDELLDQILAEVKWGAPAPTFDLDGLQFYENLTQNTDTASIQRMRLTCRRLASRASVLLLPVASVSINDPASVDRLEQIAGHAGFAPYVKAVHVYFDFYRADLANDIQLMAEHLIRKGAKLLLASSAEATAAQPLFPGGRTSADWHRILSNWGVFYYGDIASGTKDTSSLAPGPAAGEGEEEQEESKGVRLLRREHAEYTRRYEAQQCLAGSVVERIARAMARMPRATRLVLDDGPDTSAPPSDMAVPADGEWLATPTTWASAFTINGVGLPPIKALFALPAAVHRAGVELTGLRIHRLRLPSEFPLWLPLEGAVGDSSPSQGNGDPPPREAEELRAACTSLRVFEFTPGYDPDSWRSNSLNHIEWPRMSTWSGPRTRLDEVLDWMLGPSQNLQHVRVDLQMIHAGVTHELAMPPGPRWPRIRVIHLQDGHLETATLTSFLKATAGTLARLHLDGMHLFPARVDTWPYSPVPYSWSSVLDLLRAHCREGEHSGSGSSHNSTGPVRTTTAAAAAREPLIVQVRRPAGAEFDDRSLSETDMAHIRGLFEPGPDAGEGCSGMSVVDRFIQGLSERNPLVEAGKTPLLYP